MAVEPWRLIALVGSRYRHTKPGAAVGWSIVPVHLVGSCSAAATFGVPAGKPTFSSPIVTGAGRGKPTVRTISVGAVPGRCRRPPQTPVIVAFDGRAPPVT